MVAPGSEASSRESVQPSQCDAPLSVRSEGPGNVQFLLAATHGRLRGALGLSVFSHVVVAAVLLFIVAYLPPASREFPIDRRNYDIVWVPMEGPGGGGGGGGNSSPEPPPKVELPGLDPTTVPVATAPELEQPTEEEPDPSEQLVIPAMTLASAEQTLIGILDVLPATMPSSQGSGVGGGAGTGEGTGIGSGRGSGLGPGEGGGAGGGAYRPGSGVTLPRPIREVKPQYTADAMRAKIQGSVWLEAVVMSDGSVGDVKVTKSLDPVFGLDDEAVWATKQWRFVPGMRFGEPVPVLVVIELTFTLR